MSDTVLILDGLYGFSKIPVIVYETNGEIFWKNKAADAMSDLISGQSGLIFGLVSEKSDFKEENNKIGSGELRKAIINDKEFYIAEFRGERGNLLEFFADPLVHDYAYRSESIVRQTVTGISASCELINDIIEKNEKEEAALYLNNIISSCCRLMRNVTINSLLTVAADENNFKEQIVDVDEFLSGVVLGCKKALGEDFDVSYSDLCRVFVKTDFNLLNNFVFMLLRRLIDSSGLSAEGQLKISAENKGDKVNITFSAKAVAEKISDSYQEYSELDDAAEKIFADKLGASHEFSDNKLHISLQCAENNGEAVLKSDKIFFNESLFSPSSIMLGELTGFRTFY